MIVCFEGEHRLSFPPTFVGSSWEPQFIRESKDRLIYSNCGASKFDTTDESHKQFD